MKHQNPILSVLFDRFAQSERRKVEEFFERIGTEINTKDFDEALRIMFKIDRFCSPAIDPEWTKRLNILVWAKIIDSRLERRHNLQKIYDEYPWLSCGISSEGPMRSSAHNLSF